MTSLEPPRVVEWALVVNAAEGVRISDLCDAVAAHGEVLSVRFTLQGSKTTAAALQARPDVVEAKIDDFI